ncbi:MAG TPA: dihydropteroate synthase [Spirochaetota bacterium]|nr:dihydropteroate synthase [Spirochaetota bacterium]
MGIEGERSPRIMGIVNVTPDSFYDGGRYFEAERAREHARKLAEDGADILDVGGESSRPGASGISVGEEIDRVCPIIEYVARELGIPVSVDTRRAKVAAEAIRSGATIINDIGALALDPDMAPLAARSGSTVVLMHMRGTPETMQDNPVYGDVVAEVAAFLEERADRAMRAGIARERIVIDPGIGFGKSQEHNYAILRGLKRFTRLGFPVVVGLSRKSLIGRLYPVESDRLPATIALNAIAVASGADIIRVHDVREHRLAMEAVKMLLRVPDGSGI